MADKAQLTISKIFCRNGRKTEILRQLRRGNGGIEKWK